MGVFRKKLSEFCSFLKLMNIFHGILAFFMTNQCINKRVVCSRTRFLDGSVLQLNNCCFCTLVPICANQIHTRYMKSKVTKSTNMQIVETYHQKFSICEQMFSNFFNY